jgi:mRNA-degrading endonuclease HigB of HigAB toxin-antitoxin module
MANVDPTAAIILSEIILIETIIIIGAIALFIFKKNKMAKQLNALLNEHNNTENDRKSSLKETFSKLPNLQKNDTDSIIEIIINNEKRLFQYVLNCFAKNKLSDINNLSAEISTFVTPYTELTQKTFSQADEKPIVVDADAAIDELLEDADHNEAHDPALDLSEAVEEMAEIPEELLSIDSKLDNGFAEDPEKKPNDGNN